MTISSALATGQDDLELDLDRDPDPQISDHMSIDHHLHFADVDRETIESVIAGHDVSQFTLNTLRALEEHVQILEGTHPHQEQHIPKPEHWEPEQLARLEKLKQFIDVTRPKIEALLQPAA